MYDVLFICNKDVAVKCVPGIFPRG